MAADLSDWCYRFIGLVLPIRPIVATDLSDWCYRFVRLWLPIYRISVTDLSDYGGRFIRLVYRFVRLWTPIFVGGISVFFGVVDCGVFLREKNMASSNSKEYIIEISVDQKKANAALKATKKELADVRDGFKGLSAGTAEYDAQMKKLVDSTKKFAETASLTELRSEYSKLNREIGRLVPGTADFIRASAQLEVVKSRFLEVKKGISDIGTEVEALEFSAIPEKFAESFLAARAAGDGFFGSLRAGFSAVSAGLAASGPLAAVLAVVGGLVLAARAVFQVTEEFSKLRSEASQLTGLSGAALSEVVVGAKTIADTFQQDYGEVLRASNALAKEFGLTNKEALDLVAEGFLAGANSSGEFLEQIREYPAQLKEAGFTAKETVALLNLTAKEGIYSDKGVDAIKEANLKLKEGNKAALEALDVLGLNGNAIQKALQDGSKTTKDVLEDVGKEIAKLPEGSAIAQKAISDIFGGPGEDAGRRYIEMLGRVSDATANLSSNTDDLAARQREQFKATESLNEAQEKVALQFGSSTSAISLYTTQIKAFAFNALAGVVDFFAFFGDNIQILTVRFKEAGNSIIDTINNVLPSRLAIPKFQIDVSSVELSRQLVLKKEAEYDRLEVEREKKAAAERSAAAVKAAQGRQKAIQDTAQKTAKVIDEIEKGSIADLEKQISELENKIKNSKLETAVKLVPQLDDLKKDLERANLELKGIKVDLLDALQKDKQDRLDGAVEIPIEITPEVVNKAAVIEDIGKQLYESATGVDYQLAKQQEEERQVAERIKGFDEQIDKLNAFKQATDATSSGFESLAGAIGEATVAGRIFTIVARAAAVASQIAAVAAGIQAIAKAALEPFPASLIAIASTAAAIGGAIASVKNLIQAFAGGGEVEPVVVRGRVGAEQRNVPVQPNGDSVLALLTPGEVVLNDAQQGRLQQLLGVNALGLLGVPGFAGGGLVSSPVVGVVRAAESDALRRATGGGGNDGLLTAIGLLVEQQARTNALLEENRRIPLPAVFSKSEFERASDYVGRYNVRKEIE